MAPSFVSRILSRRIQAMLLVLAPSLAAAAQSYSPSPAVAGQPFVITLGAPNSGITSISANVFLPNGSGSIPGSSFVYGPLVNGVETLTATLPAGLYELMTYVFAANRPPQVSFYYFTVYGPNGSNLSALQGQYVFHLSGAAGAPPGQPAYTLGSVTADGEGNITAGIVDVNSPAAVLQALPITGTYQYNASGVGTITLNSAQGTLRFSLLTPPSLSTTATSILYGLNSPAPLPPSAYLSGASLVASAGGLIAGNGTIQQVMTPAYSYPTEEIEPTLNGSFRTVFSGGALNASGQATSLAGASQFTFPVSYTAVNPVTSLGTLAASGTTFDYSSLAGTYARFDTTTGRTTMTLPVAAGAPPEPFALYQFNNGNSFYFLSLTPCQAAGHVIAGRGDQP